MLDIEIFSVETPIYASGKKIGAIPHLSLGSYTQPTQNDQKIIDRFDKELTPEKKDAFASKITRLGQTYFASSLAQAIEESHHPIVRQKMLNILKNVYTDPFDTPESLLAQQQQILQTLHGQFRPTHMVAMMIQMKKAHDQQVAENKVSPIQDEIFARGIAKCVQSIQDLPEKEKTPQIKRFCKRSTHRWKNLDYSTVRS